MYIVYIYYDEVVAYEDVVNTFEIFKDHGFVNCAQIEDRCAEACTNLTAARCPHNDPKRLCNPGKYVISDSKTLLCFRRKNSDSFTTYMEKGASNCEQGYDDVSADIHAAYDNGAGNPSSNITDHMEFFALGHNYGIEFCRKQTNAVGETVPDASKPAAADFNARLETDISENKKLYIISYGVQDRDDNPQCGVNKRTVHVEDTMPPVIHVKWAGHGSTANIDLRNSPSLLGVSAIDNTDLNGAVKIYDVYNNSQEVLNSDGSHIESTKLNPSTADTKEHAFESSLVAEVGRTVNGWIVAGFGVAATGLALLTFSSKKTTQIEV